MNKPFGLRAVRTSLAKVLAYSIALLSASLGFAASPAADTPAWRYLLVVETSKTMQGRQEATLKAIREVLESRVRTEASPKDSLGVWTFSTELRTGQLPLQHLGASGAVDSITRISQFVRAQTNEHAPNMECLAAPLSRLAERSDGLTVILLTSGAPISGTPFDEQINAITGRWRNYQDSKGLPFVTVLRGQQGKFVDYSVTPVPWPLSWPWPPRAKSVAAADDSSGDSQSLKADAGARAVRSPKASTAPLIFSGRKTQAAASFESELLPAEPSVEAARPTEITQNSKDVTALSPPTTSTAAGSLKDSKPLESVNVTAGRSGSVGDAKPEAEISSANAAPLVSNCAASGNRDVLSLTQEAKPVSTTDHAPDSKQASANPTTKSEEPIPKQAEGNKPKPAPLTSVGDAAESGSLAPALGSDGAIRPNPEFKLDAAKPQALSTGEVSSAQATGPSQASVERQLQSLDTKQSHSWRILAAGAAISGILALLWLWRKNTIRSRPARQSIITQSLERQGGMERISHSQKPEMAREL